MKNTELDSFMDYVNNLLLENNQVLSDEQVQKLEMIRAEVSKLIERTQSVSQIVSVKPLAEEDIPVLINEKIVSSFDEYVMVNEMVRKRGNKWVVLDSKGKKVLGTHPTKEKALKQLRAIEISKHK